MSESARIKLAVQNAREVARRSKKAAACLALDEGDVKENLVVVMGALLALEGLADEVERMQKELERARAMFGTLRRDR